MKRHSRLISRGESIISLYENFQGLLKEAGSQEAAVADLFETVNNGFFQSRYDCENDDLVLQPIPYVIVFGPKKTVFSYGPSFWVAETTMLQERRIRQTTF